MVNKNRLLKLIRTLIAIDSQNPPGNERQIAEFTGAYFKKLGCKVRIVEFKKNRSNLIAVLEGSNKKRSLLLTPHLDTVPAGREWTKDPFRGDILSGRLYGLGATDCKGNLACGMEAMHSIVEDGVTLPYTIIFAATADEESGSALGLIPLLKKRMLVPDEAVVLDSDDFSIIVAQKGLMHLKVKIRGKKAHGAYPHLGTNAIDQAARIIVDLKEAGRAFKRHRYLMPPTVNTGTIQGGDKVNVVAGWCEFELDFRFLPGESAQDILASLRRTIRRHAKKFQIEVEGIQQPYEIDRTHHLVRGLFAAIKEAGARPKIMGSEGATVITFFQEKGIPAVATGFGSDVCAHMADEYVKIANLSKGAVALERFLKDHFV
jgi:succinyl-diaminopimelate desuccinylase